MFAAFKAEKANLRRPQHNGQAGLYRPCGSSSCGSRAARDLFRPAESPYFAWILPVVQQVTDCTLKRVQVEDDQTDLAFLKVCDLPLVTPSGAPSGHC